MKVAKADKDDFERVWNFFIPVEALFDNRHGCYHDEDWRDWDDDDEDKKELLEIENQLREEEGEDIWGRVDNRLVLFEFIKRRFQAAEYCGGIGRILTDAETLIESVCDPDLDYIEYRPEIKKAIDEYYKNHPEEKKEEKDEN